MALINCPECNTQISDRAEKCIKCAYPINAKRIQGSNNMSSSSNQTTVSVKSSKEGCFLQTLNTGCVIVAIIIMIILFGLGSL